MRTPDRETPTARAWQSRFPDPLPPESAASVASWVVSGPFHPAWSYWMIGAVDLRERPGVPPAVKKYPEAEFEILIASLDPREGEPDPDGKGTLAWMTPLDLVFQCDGVTAEDVQAIVAEMVDLILAARMSPDQDFRRSWEEWLTAKVGERAGS